MLKTKNQISEYLDTIEFKLLNHTKTKNKYLNNIYYTKPFNKMILDLRKNYIIQYHLNHLKQNILFELNPTNSPVLEINPHKKQEIRHLKTPINNTCYILNRNMIKENNPSLNDNQLRIYTILFYLKYYNRLNKIMKQTLKELTFKILKTNILNKLDTSKNG